MTKCEQPTARCFKSMVNNFCYWESQSKHKTQKATTTGNKNIFDVPQAETLRD